MARRTIGQHRKADCPLIWWFPVWAIARQCPSYARNLYGLVTR